jgi:RNA polymerase sigma-70 factor (ECF subfamily)
LNLCLNELRKRRIRQVFSLESLGSVLPSRDRGPDEMVESDERQRELMAAIQRLPPKQKRVFILRYFGELSHRGIAEITGREVGTVKANYFQAIQKLRTALSRL